MDAVLHAGVGRSTITPPIGIPMVGFAGRGPAESVHDPLLATAIVLSDGTQEFAIVALDLLYLDAAMVASIRDQVASATGITRVLLCASHTHYGPSVELAGSSVEHSRSITGAYAANLVHLTAGAVADARRRLMPATLGGGEGECPIGVNRRERQANGQIVLGQNPGGPCDRSVRVLRLDGPDAPLACLVNFACHPVTGAHALRELSADYVGVMRRLVEGANGASCLFLQGAAGNINPVEMRHSMEPARRLGAILAGEVMQIFEQIRPGAAGTIRWSSRTLELPAMLPDSIEAAQAQYEALAAELSRLETADPESGSLWWVKHRLERARAQVESFRTGIPLPTIAAEVNALVVGDFALATAPGEIFTETGMEIKRRSPIGFTLFAGYTNGSIGYVPVPSAYPEGGYEVTHACRVGPAAAGMIAAAAVEPLAPSENGARFLD